MVQFKDGSIKAQLGLPDMKLPIQYALTYPKRSENDFTRFDFTQYPQFTFEAPDLNVFPHLKMAFEALQAGGLKPCVLNAANEVLVEAFLNDRIKFYEMAGLLHTVLDMNFSGAANQIEDIVQCDTEVRKKTLELLNAVN